MPFNITTIEAIARLQADPDWRAFVEQLERDREEARDCAESSADLVAVRRAQGCAMYLTDVLATIRNARDTARKANR